ncbi:MAG TPA: hypothetical protein VK614_10285 [Allosphingosinicella sp.]|nr:hypothetical protein [Allosphingosinicella sp.]
MTVKLKVDLSQGILEIEGDEAIVRELHADFKTYALTAMPRRPTHAVVDPSEAIEMRTPGAGSPLGGGRVSRAKPKRNRAAADAQPARDDPYIPKVVKDLDPTGLKDFSSQFRPNSHPERILVFGKFLLGQGRDTFSADEIYTCYFVLKERLPKRFVQALIDARGKTYAFIDYASYDEITVTSIGENHFNHDMKKASAEG